MPIPETSSPAETTSGAPTNDDRLVHAIERLERTVNRFVICVERLLASDQAAAERARRHLDAAHPDMAEIRADVRKRLAKRDLGR